MKIRILSDLHLEIGMTKQVYEELDEDVVVLAGDISSKIELYQEYTKDITVPIIAIPGNHEFYGHEFHSHLSKLREAGYLYNEIKLIDDVYFVCGTGWSDFKLYGGLSADRHAFTAGQYINDFRHIRKKANVLGQDHFRTWKPVDCAREHDAYTEFLDLAIDITRGKKTVVVSHFLPLGQCISSKYEGSEVNAYFASDLSYYMHEFSGIWVHGHTHDSLDFKYGNMRILCNPHGYGNENAKEFNQDLIIEV